MKPKTVIAAGTPKGEVFSQYGRLWWRRNSNGTEAYPKGSTLDDVAAHIAGLLRIDVSEIKFIKREPNE